MNKKKIIYLGLPEDFKDLIRQDWPQLVDYELKDVIKFEVEVKSDPYFLSCLSLWPDTTTKQIGRLLEDAKYSCGEKLQVFIVRKEGA